MSKSSWLLNFPVGAHPSHLLSSQSEDSCWNTKRHLLEIGSTNLGAVNDLCGFCEFQKNSGDSLVPRKEFENTIFAK